ncbi:MAG: ACT domain-containing protein, partial [Panacagrimonas sp.]
VHPTLVPDNHLLAKVDGGLNCVLVQGRSVGPVGFYGYGAGGDPTASAVVADLIDAARSLGSANAAPALGFLPDRLQAQPIVPIQGTISSYYLRLRAADEPGVLKAITSALAEFDISIEAILQKEPREHEDATIALITSEVSEARFEKALARVSALSLVREQPSHIRVEHFNHH